MDIDRGTGEVKVRRFVAVDDCGNIINPMIVDGQIHGGLTMGLAPALLEEISYDENGNIQGGSFMDYLVPTAMETPKWETGQDGDAVAAPSARRQGRRRVGHGRRAAGDRERGGGRALAPGRDAHRHSDHAGEGLAHPEGEGGGGVAPLARGVLPRSASWASVAGGLGALLLPKCALCAAAYGSALGALGLSPALHSRVVEPLLAVAVAASLVTVSTLAVRRRDFVTPLVSAGGASLVLVGRYTLENPLVTALGALLLVVAALHNAARCRLKS